MTVSESVRRERLEPEGKFQNTLKGNFTSPDLQSNKFVACTITTKAGTSGPLYRTFLHVI